MFLREIFDEPGDSLINEARMVFARKGNSIVRRFRCTMGKKRGRIVGNVAQCGTPINLKRRLVVKRTYAKAKNRIARKRRRTMRFNVHSKLVQRLNKASRG